MADYISEFKRLIQKASFALGKEIDADKYEIVDLGIPHIPQSLPDGKMGIYTFLYKDKDQFLKIGKAGPKSGARFLSQHYNPKSAKSTLAASLIRDNDMKKFELNEVNVKKWIKDNCRRIDIIMDEELGSFTLELVEAILHYFYKPKYEGYNSQQ